MSFGYNNTPMRFGVNYLHRKNMSFSKHEALEMFEHIFQNIYIRTHEVLATLFDNFETAK